MAGEAYRFSAKIAERVKPFEGYAANREPMLEVIKHHGSESKKINLNFLDDKKLGTEAQRFGTKRSRSGKSTVSGIPSRRSLRRPARLLL